MVKWLWELFPPDWGRGGRNLIRFPKPKGLSEKCEILKGTSRPRDPNFCDGDGASGEIPGLGESPSS